MTLSLLAPAKINLFLHVVGKRPDGYHNLQSLVCFADFGDLITTTKSDQFSLSITGPYADKVNQTDNLILSAITSYTGTTALPAFHFTIEKNIPVGAGLGGGSADAATTIRALETLEIPKRNDMTLDDILLSLGADVPVCYHNKSSFIEGVGENITDITIPSALYGLIVYPNIHCATPDIFSKVTEPYTKPIQSPIPIYSASAFIDFIATCHNDLLLPAITTAPVINQVLQEITEHDECGLSQMSGSGSACFGLFKTSEQASNACVKIKEKNPDWFVQTAIFNQ